jgi:hypothetical protein
LITCRTLFEPSLVLPRSFSLQWESETASSRPVRLWLPWSLFRLFVEEIDHRFVGIEGPIQAALLDILKTLG